MNQSLQDLFESLPDDEPEQYETQTAREPREPRKGMATLLPWIIVAIVVVVAVVVSIVLVNGAVESNSQEEPPVTTTTTPATPKPTPTVTPTEKPEPEPEPNDGVPDVEVGETFTMSVDSWGTSAEVSQKLGRFNYNIADNNLVMTSTLIDSLPDSCAAMRTQWGATKTAAGIEVLKPAERCEAAPELYDEIWGLMAAMAASMN